MLDNSKPTAADVDDDSAPADERTTASLDGEVPAAPVSDFEAAGTVAVALNGQAVEGAPPSALATQRFEQLAKRWTARGIDLDTVQTDRKGTVVPDRETTKRIYARAPGPEAIQALPALRVADAGRGAAEFELGDVLGIGGMGVVKAATQTTLDRPVAIKGLKPGVNDPTAHPLLLLEARVTGTLEHPNVVPIHAIGRNDQGEPLIVMKRIEGRSWEELIGDMAETCDASVEELLQRHLNILLQVARAVHFAHSRGVLHRDLKPANVMIGSFGEVYVVDWGIAVALDDRAPSGLPKARDVAGLAGTPAYMAPEMAAGDGPSLSPRTDVYLLGAMLHELITGRAPHEAPSMLEVLRHAFASEPHDYGPDVPQGLVAICHRAMSWSPDERYTDAGQFADALEDFLHHRSSTALSDEATARLERLEAEIEAVDVDDHAQMRELRALFSEIRFAFVHARKVWPDNDPATRGLQQALELMIDFELKTGAAGAACALVAELPEPRPELAARAERALVEQRATRARLERLERDADLTIGDRTRKIFSVLGSLAWAACCVSTGLVRRHEIYQVSQTEFGLICAAFGLALGTTAYVRRQTLYANLATRRVAQTIVSIFAAYSILWPLAELLRIPPASTTVVALLMGAAIWVTLHVHVQRTWIGMAGGNLLGMLATLIWPTYNFELMGAGSVLGGTITAWLHHRAGGNENGENEPERPAP
ncbi:MAG: serine/threonine protein kinase [Deltaproteobacteria bacterium]|jgi:serine/threonine-protein kinase|nr:serine/threonine protein kinase [Deltaproteobacteria bacterium]MBW2532997.1 serine/threonine protein kinase [Deltaproteobacteria bacterium]